jgi:hypothetical protein
MKEGKIHHLKTKANWWKRISKIRNDLNAFEKKPTTINNWSWFSMCSCVRGKVTNLLSVFNLFFGFFLI